MFPIESRLEQPLLEHLDHKGVLLLDLGANAPDGLRDGDSPSLPLRGGGYLGDVQEELVTAFRVELSFGGHHDPVLRRPPRLGLQMDRSKLEVPGCIERARPAPNCSRRPQQGKEVLLDQPKFANQAPLLLGCQASIPATSQQPMPAPSSTEEPLDCLGFSLRDADRVNDVHAEPIEDLPLFPVNKSDEDLLAVGKRPRLHSKPPQLRQSAGGCRSSPVLQHEKALTVDVHCPEEIPRQIRIDAPAADQGGLFRRLNVLPGILRDHRLPAHPLAVPSTKSC